MTRPFDEEMGDLLQSMTRLFDEEVTRIDNNVQVGTTDVKERFILTKQRERFKLLTRHEWLKQQLPPLHKLKRTGVSPSSGSISGYTEYTPETVKRWESFEMDVSQHVSAQCGGRKLYSSTDFDRLARTKGFNEGTTQYIFHVVLDALLANNSLEDCWIESLDATTASGKNSRMITDLAIVSDRIPYQKCLVIEMKNAAVFTEMNLRRVPDLVKSYPFGGIHGAAVRQLMKYLVSLELCYGILSSAYVSYFFRRVRSELKPTLYSCLEVSQGITWGSVSPTLLEALDYVLNEAVNGTHADQEFLFENTEDPGTGDSRGVDDAQSEDDAADLDHDPSKPRAKKRSRKQGRTVNEGLGWKDIDATELNLEEHPYATGWSGDVFLGVMKGHRVVIKSAPAGSYRAKVLVNEVTMYTQLKECWGQYVPVLVDYGTISRGQVIYIATSFIEGGLRLGTNPLTEEVVRAAWDALRAIHSCGVLHGDLRAANILVVERSVQLIDFGFARSIINKKDRAQRERELKQLEYLIDTQGEGVF